MTRVLFAIVVIMQAADVATTYIGSLVVPGFFEANPIMAALAGQPPALWRMIALKVVVLAFVAWCIKLSGGWPIKVALGLGVLLYAAIVWNNIGVIVG